jgi:hypothetical protein
MNQTDARLDYAATTEEGVLAYYQTRARQLLHEGYLWDHVLEAQEGGYATRFEKDGVEYGSYYALAQHRGRGLSKAGLADVAPVVTTPDCGIVDFLGAHQISHVVTGALLETPEYRMVSAFYGAGRAVRSGVFFMNHIDEGLYVLRQTGASEDACRAFILHPLLQGDADLPVHLVAVSQTVSPHVLALAMEYRNIANATLSQRPIDKASDIFLSPLPEVNQMLMADKVQNYKDFLRYHLTTHPRADILDRYFRLWLERLDVSNADWTRWQGVLNGLD